MDNIRWGIAGPGCIANKFAQAIKNVDGAELVAVASRTEANGKKFAMKYNIPMVFCGYEKMAESDDVDAVYISTPHPFHKPYAEMFLNAGKHVLCEKPVCVNTFQAIRLKECAEKNKVFLMEAMWTRFLPALNEVKAIINRGMIGDVMGLTADFCYSSSPEEEAKLFQNEMAGGSLLDVGVYGLHFASMFLGNNPQSVTSVARINYDVDCHTNIILKYENGAIANISSAIMLQKPETAYIYGTDGYICIPSFYGANDFFVNISGEEKHILKPAIGNGFEEEIYEACNCIRAGKTESDIMPMSESIEILKQMDIIREQVGVKYPYDGDR